jgi:hypothetical protein
MGAFTSMASSAQTTAAPTVSAQPICHGLDCFLPDAKLDWTAIATIGLLLATAALTAATIYLAKTASAELAETRRDNQLAREENKIERTVAVCVRYESDATLVSSVRRLYDRQKEAIASPKDFATHINMVLNYLDTIAIGLEEEIYEERRTRKFMENILLLHCGHYLNEGSLDAIGLRLDQFKALVDLHKRWGVTSAP